MIVSCFVILFLALAAEIVACLLLFTKSIENSQKTNGAQTVTLLIPFKNESDNIQLWINWIKNEKQLPPAIFFVNDHSTDNGEKQVESFIQQWNEENTATRIRCIDLPPKINGKKAAIEFGVTHAETSHIVTMDADVRPASNYFDSLNKMEFLPLLLLPVEMLSKNKTFAATIGAIEYNMLQAQNYLFSPFSIMTASGANMLFSRTHFLEVNTAGVGASIHSGDDHYLLRTFQQNKIPVAVSNNKSLKVVTQSPSTIQSYIRQRTRWLGKLFVKSDWKDWIIGSLLAMVILSSSLVLIGTAFLGNSFYFIASFILILLLYVLPIFVFTKRLTFFDAIGALLMTVFYPFVFAVIISLALFQPKPKWK